MIAEDPHLDVDADLVEGWIDVAKFLATVVAPRDAAAIAVVQEGVGARLRASLLGRGGMPYHLGRTLTANLVDPYLRPPKERDKGVFLRGQAAKTLIWAWSVVRRRPEEIPPHERALILSRLHASESDVLDGLREYVTRSLDVPPPAAAPVTPPAPGQVVVVDVAFPWRRTGAALRHGSLGRMPMTLLSLDPGEAPVVVRLRRPDGGMLDLRCMGDAWLRPVLSPGSWEPVDVEGFARAMRDGLPWADHPFNPIARGGSVPFGMSDVLEEGPPPGAAEARRRDRVGAVQVRSDGLHVVHGVVHRVTSEPCLGMLAGPAMCTAEPSWALVDAGDIVRELTGRDDVSTCPETFVPRNSWLPGFSLVHQDGRGFPVGRASELGRVHRRWARAMREWNGVAGWDARGSAERFEAACEGLVEVVAPEPGAMASVDLLRHAASLGTRLAEGLRRTFPDGRDAAPHMPRHDAYRALCEAALALVDGGDPEAALTSLRDGEPSFRKVERTTSDSGGLYLWSLLREVVDALETELEPADDDAFDAFRP